MRDMMYVRWRTGHAPWYRPTIADLVAMTLGI